MRAIVRASPPGSSLFAALSPEARGWTATEYVLADVYDAIRWNTFTIARANGGKPKKPKPYPRPGVDDKQRETRVFKPSKPLPLDQLKEWLGWD